MVQPSVVLLKDLLCYFQRQKFRFILHIISHANLLYMYFIYTFNFYILTYPYPQIKLLFLCNLLGTFGS